MATMANLAGGAAAQAQNVTKVQLVCTGTATPLWATSGGRGAAAWQLPHLIY